MTLEAELRSVLGAGVGVATRSATDAPPLWPGEAEAVARAVTSRRTEFAAGRACIRAAMADLGVPPVPVPMAQDRSPVWPAGLCGSLAHGAGLCVAILARSDETGGLGVDIESDLPLPSDLAREVLSAEEAALPPRDHRAVFCVKEAVYKAFYPLHRTVWSFDAVAVGLDADGRGFAARLVGRPDAPPVRGHVLRRDGVIVTAVRLSIPN